MHEKQNSFGLKGRILLIETLPQSTESLPSMSGEFGSRKDSHPKKFEK